MQYASGRYRTLLVDYAMRASMSRTGSHYENAMVESFLVKPKAELVHHEHFATRAEAATAVFEYIEMFYSRNRLDALLQY
jgi:putative transposase